jgi:hypothetical protein
MRRRIQRAACPGAAEGSLASALSYCFKSLFDIIMSRHYPVRSASLACGARKINPSKSRRGNTGTPQAAQPEPRGPRSTSRCPHQRGRTPRARHLQSLSAHTVRDRHEVEHQSARSVRRRRQAPIALRASRRCSILLRSPSAIRSANKRPTRWLSGKASLQCSIVAPHPTPRYRFECVERR